MLQDFKSEIKTLLIVAFVSVIFTVGGFLLLKAMQPLSLEDRSPTSGKQPPVDTSNWEVYHSEEYGFELKYPPEWTANEHWDYLIKLPYIHLSTKGYAPEMGVTVSSLRLYLEYPLHPEYFSEDVTEIHVNTKNAVPYRVEKIGSSIGDVRMGVQKGFWLGDTHAERIERDFENMIASLEAIDGWNLYEGYGGFRIRYPSTWKNHTNEAVNQERRTTRGTPSYIFSNKDTLSEIEQGDRDLIGIEIREFRSQDARDLFDELGANKAKLGETVVWRDGSAYVIAEEKNDFFFPTSIRVRTVSDAAQIRDPGYSVLLPYTSRAQTFVKRYSVIYVLSPLGLPETIAANQNLIDRIFSTFR